MPATPRPRRLYASLVILLLTSGAAAQVIPCPPGTQPGVLCLQGNISDNNVGPLGGIVHCFGVTVPAGQTLTIMPGTIIKSGFNGVFQVNGLLNARNVTFTSLHDDMSGGDTNGNGNATMPSPGDWGGVAFTNGSDFSILSQSTVLYATKGVTLNSAEIFFTTTTIMLCSGAGVDMGAPQLPSFPVMANITVTQCGFAFDRVAVSAVPIFANLVANGNAGGDYVRITDGAVTAAFNTLGPGQSANGTGIFVFRTINGVVVPAGNQLSFTAGCILKMDGVQQNFNSAGTLNMTGCTVTSIDDDTIGGDTNKNGGATIPTPGSWEGLRFAGAGSAASVLSNVLIRYGGAPGAFGGLPLDLLNGADITIDTVTVELAGTGALDLSKSSFPTVQGCVFRNNQGIAVFGVPIAALAGFSNNSGSGNAGGDFVQLGNLALDVVTSSVTVDPSQSLNQSGLFVFTERIVVDPGADLTFDPGCVVKWRTATVAAPSLRIDVNTGGTLTVNGSSSSPVVLTSFRDDAVLGDSNLDGAATTPAPGDWRGLALSPGTDSTTIAQAVIRYAGALQLGAPHAAVTFSASDATVTDSIVEMCAGAAFGLGRFSYPTICNCAIDDNLVPFTGVDIDAVPGFVNNTASGNALGDYVAVDAGIVDGARGVAGAPTSVVAANLLSPPVLVMRVDLDVPSGQSLEFGDSLVVKLDGNREIDVDGTLLTATAIGSSVVFTSFGDDLHGGDTNGDGSATAGAPGDWRGVDFGPASDASVIRSLTVRFAGSQGIAVRLNAADIGLNTVLITECSGTALHLSGTSLPQIVDSCLVQNGFAMDGVPIMALPGFANNSASLNLTGDYVNVTNGAVTANLIVDTSRSLDGRPFVVADDIDVPAGITLTIEGGVTIKWNGLRELDVRGTLDVPAGGGVNALLTSIHDDSNGDTNKNGATTTPAPGDWDEVLFSSTSDASVVSGLVVRYAGGGPGGCIDVDGADITLVDSAVESGLGDALDLGGSSLAQVRRCRFDGNSGLAVDGAPLQAVGSWQDNSASGNTLGDYVRVTSVGFPAPVVVARHNANNDDGVFVVTPGIVVAGGQSLTLEAGVIIKWTGGQGLNVTGGELHLLGTGAEPVWLTTLDDDGVGGDTNKNGGATAPQPGDWTNVQVGSGAAPSEIENAVLRFGGSSLAALFVDSSDCRLRAARADFSASDGIQIADLDGDAVNLVVNAPGSIGIDLTGGAFHVVHATVNGAGTTGVSRSPAHGGFLVNSIVFGSGGADVVGFGAGEVISSTVGVDPQFADAANGVLTLTAGSPARGAADLASALAVGRDFAEASRISDSNLDGVARADQGAFERAAYTMAVGGRPRVGTVMSFDVQGPPGVAIYLVGLLDGETFFDPFGFLLAGAPGNVVAVSVRPTGTPLFLLVDDVSVAPGTLFGVQALALPLSSVSGSGAGASVGGRSAGNFTNLYRGRLFL